VASRAAHPEVHVSLVMPGPVSTEFAKNALEATARKYYEDVGAFEASMPVFGKPRT
jgi:short-subunit dehydrogenase